MPPELVGAVQLGPRACGELAALGLDELLSDAVEPQRMFHDDAVTGRTLREVGLGRALACASDDMITLEYRLLGGGALASMPSASSRHSSATNAPAPCRGPGRPPTPTSSPLPRRGLHPPARDRLRTGVAPDELRRRGR